MATTQRWSAPNKVDGRHQTCRWKPLGTSGPGPWILELHTKDLCPAVDFNRLNDDDDVEELSNSMNQVNSRKKTR
ncbi:jg7458 [Pararge aegeria aegeria]|uniref:Jg7458 protein n=1 Tax=Pararge aegeria aegeria TaxID=348720 RepID=A0A8S4RBY1_9NEOP|nr:jg7458 [Pararge aegeria aegeria]